MPRELTNIEIDSFLERHPDIKVQVQRGQLLPPISWPGFGVAVKEPSTRYVLVWADYSRRWHFIDLADMTGFGEAVGKPAYFSPDSSALQGILDALNATLTWVPWVIGGLIAFEVVRALR